jgi:hypothetical protein
MNITPISQEVVQALLESARQVRVRTRIEDTQVGVERIYLLLNGVVCTVVQEVEDPFARSWAGPAPLVTFDCAHRDLSEANLWNHAFTGSWIQTNFSGATCFGTTFEGADVWASDFRGAFLGEASFAGAYGVGECYFDNNAKQATMLGAFLRLSHQRDQSPVVGWVWGEEEGAWSATLADGSQWRGWVERGSPHIAMTKAAPRGYEGPVTRGVDPDPLG